MPVVSSQFRSVAEQAVREKKSHVGYLEALLAAELEEREQNTIAHRISNLFSILNTSDEGAVGNQLSESRSAAYLFRMQGRHGRTEQDRP